MSEISVVQPIILCLPAWLRIAQCFRRYHDTKHPFPHFISATKYCTVFFIVFFAYLNINARGRKSAWLSRILPSDRLIFCKNFVGDSQTLLPPRNYAYFYLWMVSVVMGTTFMFLWDVKLDWGLLTGGFLDNKFLRDQILYASEVSLNLRKTAPRGAEFSCRSRSFHAPFYGYRSLGLRCGIMDEKNC
jgi:hypothetical protein